MMNSNSQKVQINLADTDESEEDVEEPEIQNDKKVFEGWSEETDERTVSESENRAETLGFFDQQTSKNKDSQKVPNKAEIFTSLEKNVNSQRNSPKGVDFNTMNDSPSETGEPQEVVVNNTHGVVGNVNRSMFSVEQAYQNSYQRDSYNTYGNFASFDGCSQNSFNSDIVDHQQSFVYQNPNEFMIYPCESESSLYTCPDGTDSSVYQSESSSTIFSLSNSSVYDTASSASGSVYESSSEMFNADGTFQPFDLSQSSSTNGGNSGRTQQYNTAQLEAQAAAAGAGPLKLPIVYLSASGLLTVLLKEDIAVEMTLDRTIRVVNHRNKSVGAINARGNTSCIYHSSAKIYQDGTRTDCELFWRRRCKMSTNDITFALCDECYSLNNAGLRVALPLFSDMSSDMSVGILFSSKCYGPQYMAQYQEIAQEAKYFYNKNGGSTVYVNHVKITQNKEGTVTVTTGNKFVRVSPTHGTISVRTHFIEMHVERNWVIKVKRCGQTLIASKNMFEVCDDIRLSGFDRSRRPYLKPVDVMYETLILDGKTVYKENADGNKNTPSMPTLNVQPPMVELGPPQRGRGGYHVRGAFHQHFPAGFPGQRNAWFDESPQNGQSNWIEPPMERGRGGRLRNRGRGGFRQNNFNPDVISQEDYKPVFRDDSDSDTESYDEEDGKTRISKNRAHEPYFADLSQTQTEYSQTQSDFSQMSQSLSGFTGDFSQCESECSQPALLSDAYSQFTPDFSQDEYSQLSQQNTDDLYRGCEESSLSEAPEPQQKSYGVPDVALLSDNFASINLKEVSMQQKDKGDTGDRCSVASSTDSTPRKESYVGKSTSWVDGDSWNKHGCENTQ